MNLFGLLRRPFLADRENGVILNCCDCISFRHVAERVFQSNGIGLNVGMFFLYLLAGVTVVLKFLKFENCPEITDCPEILGIW